MTPYILALADRKSVQKWFYDMQTSNFARKFAPKYIQGLILYGRNYIFPTKTLQKKSVLKNKMGWE